MKDVVLQLKHTTDLIPSTPIILNPSISLFQEDLKYGFILKCDAHYEITYAYNKNKMPLETDNKIKWKQDCMTVANVQRDYGLSVTDVLFVSKPCRQHLQIRHVRLTHKRHKQQNFKLFNFFLHLPLMTIYWKFTISLYEIEYKTLYFYAKFHHIQIYLVHIDNFYNKRIIKLQFSMAGDLKSKPELSEK